MSNRERSTSPSILSGSLPSKKIKLCEQQSSPLTSKADKATQVENNHILDCAIYMRNRRDPSDVRGQTCFLKLTQPEEQPDPRNIEFSKLVAFELDRIPIEKRTMTYSKILDFIRFLAIQSKIMKLDKLLTLVRDPPYKVGVVDEKFEDD